LSSTVIEERKFFVTSHVLGLYHCTIDSQALFVPSSALADAEQKMTRVPTGANNRPPRCHTIKEVTGRLSVPGRAQLIGANSQARNARGMDGPWLPRSGAGWGDRRDRDVGGSTLDFDTFDYTLPINLVFGDSLFYDVQNGATWRVDVFCERMLIVRCANGVVAWLLSRTGPETATATCSQDGTVVPPSRVQLNMGDCNR